MLTQTTRPTMKGMEPDTSVRPLSTIAMMQNSRRKVIMNSAIKACSDVTSGGGSSRPRLPILDSGVTAFRRAAPETVGYLRAIFLMMAII